MAQYNTYALISEMNLADLLLVWENSTASNKTITFGDFVTDIADNLPLQSLPISALTSLVTVATDDTIMVLHSGVLKNVTFDNFVLSIAGGAEIATLSSSVQSHMTNATSVAAGLMSAADKAILDAATTSSTASTLVKRDAGGRIAVGSLTATTSGGQDGSIIGNTITINTIATIGEVDAAKIVIPGGSGGLTVCSGAAPIAMTVIYPQVISVPLVGGAAFERFNVPLTGRGFSVKPEWGVVIPVNDNYTGTYIPSDALSTSTNARCEIRKIDGTNIAGGTYGAMGLFMGLL